MVLFALDPWWNDFFAVSGFVVGVLGLIIGVGGFWIALVQIRRTRDAVEAARIASAHVLANSRNSYERFVGDYGSRLLSEMKSAINRSNWEHAEMRSNDLADLLGTVASSNGRVESISELREFGQAFSKRTNGKPKFSQAKWNTLLLQLHAQLDVLRTPFKEISYDGNTILERPRESTEDSGSGPARQDPSREGDLGAHGG